MLNDREWKDLIRTTICAFSQKLFEKSVIDYILESMQHYSICNFPNIQ